jgi:hypothetical protein
MFNLDLDSLMESATNTYEVKGEIVSNEDPIKKIFLEILPTDYRIEAMMEADIVVKAGKPGLSNQRQLTGQQLWERSAKRAAFLRNLRDLRTKEIEENGEKIKVNPYNAFLKVEKAEDLSKTPFNFEGKKDSVVIKFMTQRDGAFKNQKTTQLTVIHVTPRQPSSLDEMMSIDDFLNSGVFAEVKEEEKAEAFPNLG